MAQEDILLEAEEKMEKTLNKVQEDFSGIRTGKASPALVENLRIDCYGTTMRLRELAGITAPEPRMIMIQPWDASNVDPIRKGIEEANIGVSPLVDGKIIRIPIPELSEERRRDLAKLIKKMSEDGRIAIRHVRREALDQLKKAQKDGELTEDDLKVAEKEVQTLTDQHTEKIETLLKEKEEEIMQV